MSGFSFPVNRNYQQNRRPDLLDRVTSYRLYETRIKWLLQQITLGFNISSNGRGGRDNFQLAIT